MRSRSDTLFVNHDLHTLLQQREAEMNASIEQADAGRIQSSNLAELAAHFAKQYELRTPRLREDEVKVDQREVEVDISRDPNFAIFNRGGSNYRPGTEVSFYVPFEGDADLFEAKPSTWSSSFPHASIDGSELVISHQGVQLQTEGVKAFFNQELRLIKEYLGWIEKDVDQFNASLQSKAYQRLEARRERLKQGQSVVDGLGFPRKR